MEIESLFPNPTTCGGIQIHRRRWSYQRLNLGASTGRKKMKIIRLRRSRRGRNYWSMRPITRLRWVMRSPLKMLRKFKNAYINFMLRLAGKVGAMNTDNINIFGGKRVPKGRQLSKGYSGDAFEARLIFEISKTLIASYELYPI
ncbi:hypothetical protein RIF29_14023 [Crotalaria pallida]|uniref:Uncharacterized protein n=1 Tax=Crotalaria pallida TaxID=3830 RepID=A0AAN9I9X4_CROPI